VNSLRFSPSMRLALRRLVSRPVSTLRKVPLVRAGYRRLGLGADPWADNQDRERFADLMRTYKVDFASMISTRPSGPVGLVVDLPDPMVTDFARACDELELTHKVFDAAGSGLMDQIDECDCALLMVRPSLVSGVARQMFDEKTAALAFTLEGRMVPTSLELSLYESKRRLAYFLQQNGIPHPSTRVFYRRDEALAFLSTCDYPQVYKTNVGSSASGVEILRDRTSAMRFARQVFDRYYINKSMWEWRDTEWGTMIVQQFIEGAREHRIIRIGDSWFGHEKAMRADQEFMSGSGVNEWTPPSQALLDFCESIALRFGMRTMCFDVFETTDGRFLVNELQTWFGSYNPSQMYIDGVPGRYRRIDGKWRFEPGLYNEHGSLALRLVEAISSSPCSAPELAGAPCESLL
jgi:glutathione synthase/RimK-type ligase-like ATP-grasp enzyme